MASLRIAFLALLAALLLPAAFAAAAPTPGVPPAEALCPRILPPDDDCYSAPLPSEGWLLGTVVDVDPADARAIALYDELVTKHATGFRVPERRQIALLQFRLNVPGTPGSLDPENPGPGYGEASIALRVTREGGDGNPYTAGWFPLAQPVNDQGQYGAGRDVGIPKYMADIALAHDEAGWHGTTTRFGGRDQAGGPGIAPVDGGSSMRLDWAPAAPGAEEPAGADAIRSWTRMEDPLFTVERPYDEDAVEHRPAMVKFTPVAWLESDSGEPENPITSRPPQIGTMRVALDGALPLTPSGFAATYGRDARWSDLLSTDQPLTAPGAFWHAKGYTVITGDDLNDG